MTLHVETSGEGPDVVLLHGWGMHGGIWNELARLLAPRFRMHAVDLPGYGASAASEAVTLDALVQLVSQTAPRSCVVCGWSLGAHVALGWAHAAPRQVTRLALIAATPCFAQRDDWPCAVEARVLHAFTRALETDCDAALKRFASLQARGDLRARQVMRRLQQVLFSRARPSVRTLEEGLAILLNADLRPRLHATAQPALIVHGDRDELTPCAASEHLARMLPHARRAVVRGAAHAPFLSNLHEVGSLLTEFLDAR